jgi:hypothetical protein
VRAVTWLVFWRPNDDRCVEKNALVRAASADLGVQTVWYDAANPAHETTIEFYRVAEVPCVVLTDHTRRPLARLAFSHLTVDALATLTFRLREHP